MESLEPGWGRRGLECTGCHKQLHVFEQDHGRYRHINGNSEVDEVKFAYLGTGVDLG
ncbi:hypothetical protein SNOG_02840 [Parastagonospora nodorum SN15]|uniref:Uncharacterized protein n=1 Tax=Phaeosphaeria nodorum (strain SN15 / ATCC MYA-4574 / FGSC 10173) TaxID=321614 RepID=Q0UZH4_PHANO|nr:hypothetical protein SNOG_02840 [Parastagonospora nodorum SN15]EAT89571.1 hypothetical protein SNOG_02840 [Parastagonospora nodorum SN15]